MKKLVIIFLLALSIHGLAAPIHFTVMIKGASGTWWWMHVTLPDGYNDPANASKRYPMIIFLPGAGESGTDSSKLDNYGPHSRIRYGAGWNGGVVLPDRTIYPIIVSLQTPGPSGFVHPTLLDVKVNKLLDTFRVKANSVYGTGLSAGAWAWNIYVTYKSGAGNPDFASKIKAIGNIMGVRPDDTYDAMLAYPNRFDYWASIGGKEIGYENIADGRDINTIVTRMNGVSPGSAVYIQTAFGDGSHCCFEQVYGAAGVTPAVRTIEGRSLDVYQYLITRGDTTVSGPTVNAGADIFIDQYTHHVRLIASISASGTPTIVWKKVTSSNDSTHANILDPTNDTTDVRQLDYNGNIATTGGWNFNCTVTDANGTATDEVKVKVYFGPFPPQRVTLRLAVAADTTFINNTLGYGILQCKINDLMLDGANDGWDSSGKKSDIFIFEPAILTTTPLQPGSNIWVNGSGAPYRKIQTTFAANQIQGTKANPVTMRAYGGKVVAETISFVFSGQNNGLRMTGLGVPGYPSLHGAFTSGTYGIEVDGRYGNILSTGISVSGKIDDFEIDHVEVHGGHFAAMQITSSDATDTLEGFRFHDNYVHHTHSEGIYGGKTSEPTALFSNSEIYNNRFSYTGSEITQMVNLNHDNWQHNNVHWLSAINRYSPFNESQDFGPSFNPRNGRNGFRDNIVVGAGEQLINWIMSNWGGVCCITQNNGTFDIKNNLISRGTGFIGLFFGYGGADLTGPDSIHLVLDSNITGKFNYKANGWFKPTDQRGVNTMQIIRVRDNSFHISVKNTIRDNTKTQLLSDASNADTSGTTVWTIPDPQFINSGWADNADVELITQYVDSIYRFHHDEENSVSNKQDEPRIYSLNEIVTDYSKYYRSKINGNTHHMPIGVTDDYWELITWTMPNDAISYLPPDDLRLVPGSFYHTRKMGLTDGIEIPPPPYFGPQIKRIVIIKKD